MSNQKVFIKKAGLLSAGSISVIAMLFASAPVAYSQSNDTVFSGDEVIVTARKREENIQSVPLSIAAFSEEDFQRRNIENLDDVARLTAGLSFEDFSGGFATPIIRGQTQTRLTALESNVSTFLDGVFIPRAWAIDVGTSSLNRIEVVKGPQSARYGRNAFAGAINYVPFKASLSDDRVSGQIEGTVGSDERFDAGGRVNLALDPRFAVAGSFNYSTFDGSFDNSNPFSDLDLDQGTEGNVGGFDNTSFSISAIANPVDALTVEASFNSYDVENEARAGQNLSQFFAGGGLNCGGLGTNGSFSLFCGDLPSPGEDANTDPRAFDTFAETDIFRLAASYEISDSLDVHYTFGSVSGDVESAGSSEVDQTNCGLLRNAAFFFPLVCSFTASPIGSIDYDSHELRVVYDDSSTWRFEVGGFLSDGEDRFESTVFNAPILEPGTDLSTIQPANIPENFSNSLENTLTTTDVSAIFGAIEWRSPSERLKLGAEVRYSENDIEATNLLVDGAVPLSDTFSFVTPRFTADYALTDQSLLYASVARGAKAGGFSPTATNEEDQTFDEETNWTYELGLKNQFLDNRLVLNGALFYTDWNDLQISSPDPGSTAVIPASITDNLGGARVFGFEVESAFQVTDNLSVDGTLSYTNAEYNDGVIDQRFIPNSFGFVGGAAPCDGIVCPLDGDIGGNQIERSPSTQVSVGTQWEDALPAWNADYYIRGDLSWQNRFFADTVNLAEIPDRFLLGASAGINFDNVGVKVWARNLTDENFVSNSFVVVGRAGNSFNTFFGERRTFGGTLTYNF